MGADRSPDGVGSGQQRGRGPFARPTGTQEAPSSFVRGRAAGSLMDLSHPVRVPTQSGRTLIVPFDSLRSLRATDVAPHSPRIGG